MLVHLEKLHVCKIGAGGGGGLFLFLLHSMPHYTVILHALHNLRFN